MRKENGISSIPDINKQITYGEYIERTKRVPNENLYNAFIMPFNKEDNPFWGLDAQGELVLWALKK